MEAVTIQKLSKTYPGGKEALKQLSLSLSTGEVFGFLGPNGLRYKLKKLSSTSLR